MAEDYADSIILDIFFYYFDYNRNTSQNHEMFRL